MKALLIALVAVAAISMVTFTMMKKTAPTLSVAHIPEEVQKAFSNWKSQLGKVYDGEEESYRLNVFYANYKFVNSHQSREYELGLNEFADLSTQEFAKFYLGFKGEKKPATNIFVSNVEDVPASVDWRTSNKVSAVKNQGQCGSCWAFSTTGSLESEAAIHGTGLNSFSEQQLVDCSTAQGNQGCNGGLMDDAFTYVIAKGITTESAYPYEGVDQDCKTMEVPSKSPSSLISLLATATASRLPLLNNRSALPLMPSLGNSTLEESSLHISAVNLWTTESWPLDTMQRDNGSLRTHGENFGDRKDTSPSEKETLADFAMLPASPLFERI